MNEEIKQSRVQPTESQALVSGTSAKEASDLLFQLLVEVVREHQPEIEPVLKGGANIYSFTPELMARALQAQGIWFQLLSIAEQNAAMRRRRQIERTRGRAGLRGSFDHVLAEASAEGVPPRDHRGAAVELAHPPGDHRAPDRVEARHSAREIPPHLSLAARARDAALDRARACRADRRSARSDRARMDDRRAALAEADRGARGVQRPPLLRREPVREGAGDAIAARRRATSITIPARVSSSRRSSSSARGSAATATATRR